MKTLDKFQSPHQSPLQFLFTDIDDTMTDEGLLGSKAYSALWSLHDAGIHVIPVTGRPAGWCEMIARVWPVAGVIGENGGFYFRYHQKNMQRHFVFDAQTQIGNREKLNQVQQQILSEVKGSALASDQFCRMMDLAIDFCEDVSPLPPTSVDKIVSIFERNGAQAKISSIHVNGWFGNYNKVSMALQFLEKEFRLDRKSALEQAAFVGDSLNDEPMFEVFPQSFAVANIQKFLDRLTFKPAYISPSPGGEGFAEIAQQILTQRDSKRS